MTFENMAGLGSHLFIVYPFTKINKNLRNFNSYQISVGLAVNENEELPSGVFEHIQNEFNQNISKQMINGLISTKKFDYYDVSKWHNLDMMSINDLIKVSDFIIDSNNGQYKNIIASPMVACVLQDLARFSVKSGNFVNAGIGRVYNVGSISGIEVWVDPFMKYNDTRVIMFNDVNINIEDIDIRMDYKSSPSFNPRLMVSHELALDVGDSKVLFLLDSQSHPEFQRYKSLQRDIKINDILDEKE
jgi:hypothetical protein